MFDRIKTWLVKKKADISYTTIIVVVITVAAAILIFIGRKIWTSLLK